VVNLLKRHLGRIINYHSDDKNDVLQRRRNLTGQANNVFFQDKYKIKLFKSYYSSIYGSELWSSEDDVLQDFWCSWRTARRRLLNLPFNAHFFLLPILTGNSCSFDEISKRSSRFCIRIFVRVIILYAVLLCTALFMVNIICLLVN